VTILNWECPHCGTFTTINVGDDTSAWATLNDRSTHGPAQLHVASVSCPNPKCKQMTIDLKVYSTQQRPNGTTIPKDRLHAHRLWPEGKVMPLPNAVPEAIRKTYREAVLVKPVSGTASAALSRRCLQGIVRDFFEIPQSKRGELGAELSFVKDRINSQVWDDIQAVRAVGDIGAHMDKNVDYIVDVDPKEADLLVGLIEELFKVWYMERERRSEQSKKLHGLLVDKRQLQKDAKIAAKDAEDAPEPDAAQGV
jgi:hypothetical protein